VGQQRQQQLYRAFEEVAIEAEWLQTPSVWRQIRLNRLKEIDEEVSYRLQHPHPIGDDEVFTTTRSEPPSTP